MPVTGTIEQAPRNAYFLTDALSGDIMFRSLCNNSWLFGDGSNTSSIVRINKNMISSTANVMTHAGNFGVSNLNPQFTLDVAGDVNFTGMLRQNGNPYVGSQWSNNGTTNQVFIMGSNIGIGTSNPQYALHVPTTTALSNLVVSSIDAIPSSGVVNIGTGVNTNTVNIGGNNTTVNISGTLSYVTATDLTIADKRITLNKNGAANTATDAGIEFEEAGAIRGYIKTSSDRNSFLLRTPNGTNDMTLNLQNNAVNINNNLLFLNSNSRVGIGTGNPGYTFEVQGVIHATSNILINGQPLQVGYWYSTGTSFNWSQSNTVVGSNVNPNSTKLYIANTVGTTNTGATGDGTNINSNIMTLQDAGVVRIVHRSGNATTSTTYNFESNKNVFWGEATDTGYYSFRGRGLSVGYSTLPSSNYSLDVNGSANVSDRLFVTNTFSLGTINTPEKFTLSAGNMALIHGGAYGGSTTTDKWISIGERTQTTAPQFQTSNYGMTVTWDTDGCFFGLRDMGPTGTQNRKDTVISFGDNTNDFFRVMYSNAADYMSISGLGFVGINKPNPSFRLDVDGDINFTGTFRQNGNPYIGSQWSNSATLPHLFITGCNVGIGTNSPQRMLHVAGDVQFDSNIFITNTNIAVQGLRITQRPEAAGTSGISTIVTQIPGFTWNSNITIVAASLCNITLGSTTRVNANLGVNVVTPNFALDVNGDINFTGTFRQNGNPYIGSQFSNTSTGSMVFTIESNLGIGTSTRTTTGTRLQINSNPMTFSNECTFIVNANNDGWGATPYAIASFGGNGTNASSNPPRVMIGVQNGIPQIAAVSSNHAALNNLRLNNGLITLQSVANASNVGINTTSPAHRLDVNGDINFNGILRQNGVPYIGSQWSNNGTTAQLFITGSNVGIGTNNPQHLLSVGGDINFTGILRQNGTPYVGSQWSNSTGVNNVFITGSNIGIGTNNPQRLLHVAGELRVDSNIFINNTSIAFPGIQISRRETGGQANITSVVNQIPGFAWNSNIFLTAHGNCNITLSNATIINSNVGIKTAPSALYDLNVNGSINLTGTLFQNGVAFSTTPAGYGVLNGNIILTPTVANSNVTINNRAVIQNGTTVLNIIPNTRAGANTTNCVQYNLGGTGTHFFWNDLEVSSNLLTSGTVTACNRAILGWGGVSVAPQTRLVLAGESSNNHIQFTVSNVTASNRNWGMGPYADCNFRGYIWDDTFGATTDWLQVARSNMTISNVCFPSGNVGVGTIAPTSRLTVNPHVIDSGGFSHINCPLTVTHPTPGNTTVLNDQLPVLHLCRQGQSGQAFGTRATIALSRYENNSINSRTRMDFQLSHGSYDSITVMSVRSDGNVGIGTTTPARTLHIQSSARIGGANAVLDLGDDFTAQLYRPNTTSEFRFVTNSADRMTITSSGNVGIGTSSPGSLLSVSGTSRFTGIINADTTSLAVPASGTTGGAGDRIIMSQGSVGVFPYSIGMETNGLWSSVPTGASHRWYINGTAQMQLNASSLTCIQDVIAFGSVSDEKLKEDIMDISTKESLDVVNSLRPVSYRWKNNTFNEFYRGKEDIGFIAQEVESVLPKATLDTMMMGEEYKTIKYERILPMLVGAIKELSAKYDDMKEKYERLLCVSQNPLVRV